MNIEQIIKEIFPHSTCSVSHTQWNSVDTTYIKLWLAGSKAEVYNGYFENDALSYFAQFDHNTNTFKVDAASICGITREGEHWQAYSRYKLFKRKPSFKGVTEEKLRKHFTLVRDALVELYQAGAFHVHHTELCDIASKLGDKVVIGTDKTELSYPDQSDKKYRVDEIDNGYCRIIYKTEDNERVGFCLESCGVVTDFGCYALSGGDYNEPSHTIPFNIDDFELPYGIELSTAEDFITWVEAGCKPTQVKIEQDFLG